MAVNELNDMNSNYFCKPTKNIYINCSVTVRVDGWSKQAKAILHSIWQFTVLIHTCLQLLMKHISLLAEFTFDVFTVFHI